MENNKILVRNLRVGDLLLYRDGKSLLSRLIRWGTNSPYSHAILYIGRGKCLESDFSVRKFFCKDDYCSGVRIVSLRDVRRRSGSHDVFRSVWRLRNVHKTALQYVKKGFLYDFVGLIWRAVVCAKLKFLQKQSFVVAHDKNKYYCSELSREIHERCGAFVFDGLIASETTPASESERDDLNFIGNLSSTKWRKS